MQIHHRVTVGVLAGRAPTSRAFGGVRAVRRALCALAAAAAGVALVAPPASAATLLWHDNVVYGVWPPPTGGIIGPTRPLTETSTRWNSGDAACTGAANTSNNPVGDDFCSWDVAVHPYNGTERRPWAGAAGLTNGVTNLKARVNW